MQSDGWNLKYSYRTLPSEFFADVYPEKAPAPSYVVFNDGLARTLGLETTELAKKSHLDLFSGHRQVHSLSQAYAGNQYGHFAMLGDGRAVLLGEQTDPSGRTWDVQLKGSGQTPYSRRGDGKAALGPMLREYLISEFMSAVGVPTTRSLAVVLTGESVHRAGSFPGAILVRVAEGHIRVGTFEFAAQFAGPEKLKQLAEYTISRHFSHLVGATEAFLKFFFEVVDRQARLISKWLSIGFVHGVMNTDNMSIVGETIDYGPCAFLDKYDPSKTFSSIDHYGRYAFSNQPNIGLWNLDRFAETLKTLIPKEVLIEGLEGYKSKFQTYWLAEMLKKIGFSNSDERQVQCLNDLLVLMSKIGADFTTTFSDLARKTNEVRGLSGREDFESWFKSWQQLGPDIRLMQASNPFLIPRNHQVERAIRAAEDQSDFTVFHQLLRVIQNPFDISSVDYQSPPSQNEEVHETFCGT